MHGSIIICTNLQLAKLGRCLVTLFMAFSGLEWCKSGAYRKLEVDHTNVVLFLLLSFRLNYLLPQLALVFDSNLCKYCVTSSNLFWPFI